MSNVKSFNCQHCSTDDHKKKFFYDLSVFRVRDTENCWLLGIRSFRDGDALEITDDAGSLIATIYCSVKTQMLDHANNVGPSNSKEIVVSKKWSVVWPSVFDRNPPVPGLTREYIVDFFCFYKGSNGVGAYVDGEPKDAIVQVDLVIS